MEVVISVFVPDGLLEMISDDVASLNAPTADEFPFSLGDRRGSVKLPLPHSRRSAEAPSRRAFSVIFTVFLRFFFEG